MVVLALFNGALASCHQDQASDPIAEQSEVADSVQMPSLAKLSAPGMASSDGTGPQHPCQNCDGQCSASCSSATGLPVLAPLPAPASCCHPPAAAVTAVLSGFHRDLLRPPSILIG